jgi:predicted HTH transcriptional regulator
MHLQPQFVERGMQNSLEIFEPLLALAPWRNLNVLAVQVYPSNTRPNYLERLGPEDGVYIRVGSTNRKGEPLQIEELKRLNRMNSFDEQAIPDLKSEAIDFRAASELLAPYRQITSRGHSAHRHGKPRSRCANHRRIACVRQG